MARYQGGFGSSFDPENIRKEDMAKLAEIIEEYIDQLESVMIIPEDVMRKHGDKIKEAIKRCKKLVKKLKKGDRSVFKDPDEWERYSLSD